jgi:hypothetical protein
VRTYRGRSAAAARRALQRDAGITATALTGERPGDRLRWRLYLARRTGEPELSVELAVARHDGDAYVAALVSRKGELGPLVRSALLAVLDSFVPGSPDAPTSVLAGAPPDPSYWPTGGWRTASPASQGMDGERLAALVDEIRSAQLPIDSVTVVRHGNVVLDQTFGAPADGSQLLAPRVSARVRW